MAEASNWIDNISALLDRVLDGEEAEREAKQAEAVARQAKLEAQRDIKDAKGELHALLSEAGVMTENHPRATITLAAGRVSLDVSEDADPESLPIDLIRIRKEADKAAIQAALTRGDAVPGYSLKQSPPSLRIKFKEITHAG